jgi:WD40-like Beta Propeller Repeat
VRARETDLPSPRPIPVVLLTAGALAAACTPFDRDSPAYGAPSGEIADAGPTCDPMSPFVSIVPVSGLENFPPAGGLRLSRSYLTGFFHTTGTGGDLDLYSASRDSDFAPFGNVEPIVGAKINTANDETDPTVSRDGITMVFARGLPGPGNPLALYVTHAYDMHEFTTPEILAGASDGRTPFLTEDGGWLYFSSTRVPEDQTDLYRAAWDGSGAGVPAPIHELNTAYNETAPVVAPNGLSIYFGSDRSDGAPQGGLDVWVATRMSAGAEFSAPANVRSVNSRGLDLPTFITRDGCTLYLTSTRAGNLGLYVATRRPP